MNRPLKPYLECLGASRVAVHLQPAISRSDKLMGTRLAALVLLAFLALAEAAPAKAQHRLDSSASPRQQVAALQVLDGLGQPFGFNPFAQEVQAHFGRVEFRLATAPFSGRRARISLVLAPQVPGLQRNSGLVYRWRGLDGALSGQVSPGQRQAVWTGVVPAGFTDLAIEPSLRLDLTAMGRWQGGHLGVEPLFELELLP